MAHELKRHRVPLGLGVLTVLAFSLTTRADSTPGRVALSTQRFTLEFASDGRPLSLKTREDGREWLATGNPGPGFYLNSRDRIPLRFERLKMDGGRLLASCVDGLPRVTFRVHEADTYLALHVERLEAVPASREYSLHFQMNLERPIGLIELDYMTEARTAAGPGGAGQGDCRGDRHRDRQLSLPLW